MLESTSCLTISLPGRCPACIFPRQIQEVQVVRQVMDQTVKFTSLPYILDFLTRVIFYTLHQVQAVMPCFFVN